MPWTGIPLLNTLILLALVGDAAGGGMWRSSVATRALESFLAITVLLGVVFLFLQGLCEYMHAYRDLGLRLDSGVYGNTFYPLTGFHGL